MRKFRSLLLLSLLPGCATLVNGTSQTVTVATTPPSASCTLDRVGARVGVIPQTPGSLRIDKSKNELSVTCSKDGFDTATVTRSPSFSGATFGNIIAGGLVGVVVDAASGANYAYPDTIELALNRTRQPTADTPTSSGPIVLQPAGDRAAGL